MNKEELEKEFYKRFCHHECFINNLNGKTPETRCRKKTEELKQFINKHYIPRTHTCSYINNHCQVCGEQRQTN